MTEIIYRDMTPEEIEERSIYEAGERQRELDLVAEQRRGAYQNESDPLFFKYQRGEATEQEWKDKVAEIQARYPDPA